MAVFITRISREVVVPKGQRQTLDLSLTQSERTCMLLTVFRVTQLVDSWVDGAARL